MSGIEPKLEPDEPRLTSVTCAFCYEQIAVGESVRETYDNEIVHDDECWRDYCDEMYSCGYGILGTHGHIE